MILTCPKYEYEYCGQCCNCYCLTFPIETESRPINESSPQSTRHPTIRPVPLLDTPVPPPERHMGRVFRDRASRGTRESDSSGVSVVTIPRAHFRGGGGGGGSVSSYAGQHFNHQHRNSGDRRTSGTPGLLHLFTCTGGGGFGGGGFASSSSARSDRESMGSNGGHTGRDVRPGFHLPPRFRRQTGPQDAYPYSYEYAESCTAQWTANTNRCSSRAAALGGGFAAVAGTGVAQVSRDRDRDRDRDRERGGGEKEREVVGNKLSGGDSGKESQLSSDSGEANNSCCPEARADAAHAGAAIVSSAPPAPSAQTQFSFFYGPSYAAAADDAAAATTTARIYPAAATNDSGAHEHVPEGGGNESSKPMLMGQRNEAASSSSTSSSSHSRSHSRSHSKPADLVDGAGCAPDAAVTAAPEQQQQQQQQPCSRPPSNSNAAHPPALLPTPAGTASDSSITRVPLSHPKQSLSLSHSHNAVAMTTRATPNATAIDRNAVSASASASLGVTGMHSAANLPGAAGPLHQLKLPQPQPQPQPQPATISALQYLSTCNMLGQSALAPNNANAAAAAAFLQQHLQAAALLQAAASVSASSATLSPFQALTALAMNQQRAGGGLIATPSAPPLLSAVPLMHAQAAQFPFVSTAAALTSAASVALNRSLSVQQFLPAAATPTGMMLDSSLGKARIGVPSSTLSAFSQSLAAPSLAKFQLGDECEALYAGDHHYYRAIVVRVSDLGASVVFPEYGPEMYEVPLEHLRSVTPPVTPSSGAARAPASSTPLLRGAAPAAGAATPSSTSVGGSCGAASFTVNGSSNASSASFRLPPASDSPPSHQQQQTVATAKLDPNTSA